MADQIRAADLPHGSVVANASHAWIRNTPGVAYPWQRSGGPAWCGETDIDEVLAAGGQVLRVGFGQGADCG